MQDPTDNIRAWLRELERSFSAFERGERGRLFESRDALTSLSASVEQSEHVELGPVCEIASRLLGIVLMEGSLSEARAVHVVRELLSYIEAQVMDSSVAPQEVPGGVFHVVNSERLGDILVRQGLIAPDQLEKALLLQRVSKGKRVGQVLVAMNAIDQKTLDSVLNSQREETRRAETRRSSAAQATGAPSIQLEALPPLPSAAPPAEPAPTSELRLSSEPPPTQP